MTHAVLAGKIALVTGGSRGLGRGIALGLARHGADVIIASRKLAACDAVAAEIKSLGRNSLAVAADLGRLDDIRNLVAKSVAEFGRIDILINNAGTSPVNKMAVDIEEWAWDKIFNTNLKGAFFCAQETAKVMMKENSGKIINITSAAGQEGSPFLAPYGASKAALIHLTRTLALEWAPHGIRVNAIGPATFEVGVSESIIAHKAMADSIIAKTPLGRLGKVEDLIGAVILFASDASDYITGQTLFIDGGWLA